MNKNIIIFGTGEFADLCYFYINRHYKNKIKFFTVDDSHLKESKFNNLDILPFSEVKKKLKPIDYSFFCAISYTRMNSLRAEKFNDIKSNKYEFINYIDERSVIAENVQIGTNCLILENQTIQPFVKIGDNSILWSSNHIGHGTSININNYISSHVVISGNCNIGKNCFFGVNSSVKDFTSISDNCFIGMNANVVTDLSEQSTVVDNKSNIFDKNHKFSNLVRKKY